MINEITLCRKERDEWVFRAQQAAIFTAAETCKWFLATDNLVTECGKIILRYETNDWPPVYQATHCPYCGEEWVEVKDE